MQTEQQTQERRIVNPRRRRFDTEKSSGARDADLKFNGASQEDGDGSEDLQEQDAIGAYTWPYHGCITRMGGFFFYVRHV